MSVFSVVGGAGFIGSHLVDALLKEGHHVRVLDNFSSGKRENLDDAEALGTGRLEVIEGDLCDASACEKVCQGADYVHLLAALRSVPVSLKFPEKYNEVNINGTLKLLQSAAANQVKRLVFSSSSSVYGESDVFPLMESMYPKLMSPYALTKLAGEYYCRIFSEHFSLNTVCLRYFNVFGPRQALDDEYAVVVPKFIACVTNGENPPIFGDGHQSRDFTYVSNVVDANIRSALTPGISHEVFNIAVGEETSVLRLAELINEVCGKSVDPVHLPKRAGDIYRTQADISKIRKMLGYQPRIGVKEGLVPTVEYFQKKILKRDA